jgi:hypothetical protein
MSDDANERPREHDEPQDEVEAHQSKKFLANDEPAAEGDTDDEVEAHIHRKL